MAEVFKAYIINSSDDPGLIERILGKRKTREIIKPLLMYNYDYIFLDKTRSVLFSAKYLQQSRIDGAPLFIWPKASNNAIASDIKYIRADNGVFKIRYIENIRNLISN